MYPSSLSLIKTPQYFRGCLEANFVRRVRHEVDILNHLGRSFSVAYLYDVYEDEQAVDLVLELCEGGQLWNRVRKGSYSEATVALM
jgi:calcium-dependent protein kinase